MSDKKILIETSARHLHVSGADLDVLYGPGYQLTNKKDLSQPGQFACEEKVTVVGPKGELKMSILGPERSATQVEVSLTDARTLGLKPPVRESGDIAGTPGAKLIGPAGELEIKEGVMVAKRHIHFHTSEAKEFGCRGQADCRREANLRARAASSSRKSSAVFPTTMLLPCISTPTRPMPPVSPATWRAH